MGRGSSGIGAGSMNVDWDKWGKVLDGADSKRVYDEDGNVIGYIRDEIRYEVVPEERPVTKADVMRDISGWKNDDGSYGDEDTHIFIAYDDGTFYSDGHAGTNYREKLKKTGVIGASISTPDYEMVWGGERDRNGDFVPWTTHSPDGEGKGKSNTYSGYKTVGEYRVRVKMVNARLPNGRLYTKTEVIRKSKVRKVDW